MTENATPLVLLHGLGQAPMAWEDVVVPLYGSRRLLTPWVPGLRPTEKEPVTFPDAAAALDQQLMLEGLQAVDVCGLTYGGRVALQVAADFPERVRRLVLVGVRATPSRLALRAMEAGVRMAPSRRLAEEGISKDRLLDAIDASRTADTLALLPRITAPTLVLVGEGDRATLKGARDLAKGIRGAELRTVPGAGVQVNEEAPAALVEILRDFLDGSV